MGLDFFQKWRAKAEEASLAGQADRKKGFFSSVLSLFRVGPVELGIILIIIFLAYSFSARGSSFDFYPTNCLGSWESAANAQGAPENPFSSGPDLFSRENSAVFSGGAQQIVCADFSSSVIDDSLNITEAKLYLVSSLKNVLSQEAEPPAEPASDLFIESASSSPSEESPQAEDVFESIDNTGASESSNIQAPEEVDLPSESAPASSLFISKAFAQEEVQSGELARAYYTLDGQNWHLLGVITEQNANSLEFSVPVLSAEGISAWQDIARLQVKIEASFFTLSGASELYLDGMILTVSYSQERPSPQAEPALDVQAQPPSEVLATEELENIEVLETFSQDIAPIIEGIKKIFLLRGEVLPAKTSLPWQPIAVQKEAESGSQSFVDSSLASQSSDDIVLTGRCAKDYFAVLIFSHPDSYISSPASAVYNSAFPCQGGFSVSLSQITNKTDLPAGVYYLLVADQPKDGVWTPISGIISFEVK